MAKIARASMKIFGSGAGFDQISVFGSLYASAPAFSTDPETIQSLSNYLTGWFAAAIANNSPAIEDMNAICYLYAYQLSYVMQAGIAEWDDGTTYYIGSLVNDGSGNIYTSLIDTNLNHLVTDATKWRPLNPMTTLGDIVYGGSSPAGVSTRLAGDTSNVRKYLRSVSVAGVAAAPAWDTLQAVDLYFNMTAINPATQSPYTLTSADNGKTFLVNSANGAMTFTLPVAATGFHFEVKDVAGSAPTNPITIARHAAENIENLGANYSCSAAYGIWGWGSDATNWWLIG